jgi:steroid delta-isomerase-like uncharacterized protein
MCIAYARPSGVVVPFEISRVHAPEQLSRGSHSHRRKACRAIAFSPLVKELVVLALFTDDCVFEDVTFDLVARGKQELRSFVTRAFTAVPDFKYDLQSRLITQGWAAIEWVMSGTHQGDFPGLPATGKRFSSVRGTSILQLEAARSTANPTTGTQPPS